jgi:hypothetical protein
MREIFTYGTVGERRITCASTRKVTVRAEPLWQDVVKLKIYYFIEVSGSLGCS